MATSEIEKLERRYAENPHGLTFAPLAEVHRKNGDIPRALELLTAGLELHPNYIPASIVLGRCHQDLDDLPSAEAAFAHVLRLDDENVIALKSLADISERQQRYVEAESWLRRLVSVDRSNDDAKEQLERVQAAKQSGRAEPPAAPPAADPEKASPPAAALEMIDLSPPAPSEPVAATDAEPPEEEGAAEPARDLPFIETSAAAAPPPPEVAPREPETPAPAAAAAQESSPEPPPSPEENVQPLPGLISAEFQPPLEAIGGLDVETSEEVLLEPSGSSEFSVPDASEDLKSLAARLAAPTPAAIPAEKSPVPAFEPPPPVAAGEPEPVVAEPEPVVAGPEPVVAEPEPVVARPEPVAAPPEPVAQEPAPVSPEAPRPRYLARETNGQSVAAFFRALLAARLPSDASASAPNAGHNGAGMPGYGEEAVPAPPAVPAGDHKGDGAVSFDDFFASEADEATPLRQGKSEPGKDDLDQFQSWLQNLKR